MKYDRKAFHCLYEYAKWRVPRGGTNHLTTSSPCIVDFLFRSCPLRRSLCWSTVRWPWPSPPPSSAISLSLQAGGGLVHFSILISILSGDPVPLTDFLHAMGQRWLTKKKILQMQTFFVAEWSFLTTNAVNTLCIIILKRRLFVKST